MSHESETFADASEELMGRVLGKEEQLSPSGDWSCEKGGDLRVGHIDRPDAGAGA